MKVDSVSLVIATLFICNADCQRNDIDSNSINFLSFFPCTNISEIRSAGDCDIFLYPAALLAQEHINNHQLDIFTAHDLTDKLRVIETQTRGDIHYSTFSYVENVRPSLQQVSVHGIIGPDSSDIAEMVAYISGLRLFRTPMVSYGATDPLLSNQERYPYFFRTIPSEELINIGRLQLLQTLGWFRIGMLSSTEHIYARAAEKILQQARSIPGMKITYYGSFSESTVSAFDQIYNSEVKIILGMFGEEYAQSLLCMAKQYRDGSLLDSTHVWILPSYYDLSWWRRSNTQLRFKNSKRCSSEEMQDILNSVLFVNSFNYHATGNTTSQVLTIQVFIEQLLIKTRELFPSVQNESLSDYLMHSHAANVYDAVWALALAWNSTIPTLLNEQFYEEQADSRLAISRQLKESMQRTAFEGIAGYQQFNASEDGHGTVLISQFVDGVHKPVGVFELEGLITDPVPLVYLSELQLDDEGLGSFIKPAQTFVWKSPTQPSDGVQTITSSISPPLLGSVGVLIAIFMIIPGILLMVNIIWRKNHLVKASSPCLNVIVIVCVTTLMPSALLTGLSLSRSAAEYSITKQAADAICKIDLFTRNIGYVGAVSILLAKNWRIYRIFYNNSMRTDIKGLSDTILVLMALVFTLPLLVLLILWQIIHPLVSHEEVFEVNATARLQVTFCFGDHINAWRGVCIGYICILVLVLLFFSLQNSRVSSKFVEEGRGAGKVVILNVAALCVFIVGIAFVEMDMRNYTVIFWLSFCGVVILPTTLLIVVYGPYLVAMYWDWTEQKRKRREDEEDEMLSRQYSRIQRQVRRLKSELNRKRERINIRHYQKQISRQNTEEVQAGGSGVQRNTKEALDRGNGASTDNSNSNLPTQRLKKKTVKVKTVSISSEAPLVFS